MENNVLVYPVMKIDTSSNSEVFINFWKKFYNYKDYDIYKELLHKKYLEANDLYKLYKWKNGMDLSGKKRETYNNKIQIHLDLINRFRHEPQSLDVYKSQLKLLGLSGEYFYCI
jgi:hypothetical protein